jgi:hypothetical protein
LVERQLGRALVERGEKLALGHVLAGLHVHLFERAAGLEVDIHVRAGLDVAGTRDGRLHDALLGGDDLRRGTSGAGRWAQLGNC